MGGQDGFSRDLLEYETTSDTIMGGLRFRPDGPLDVLLDVAWNSSDAGLDAFALPADEYVATHPPTAYDFSSTHTYSNLDLSRLEASLEGRWDVSDDTWLRLRYRWIDFDDDDPYLFDVTGSLGIVTAAFGWAF